MDPADGLIEGLLPRCTFPPAGTSVVCGVSGGADSSALVVLARAAGLDVHVVHIDHGLRAGGADEARMVGALANRFGASFRSTTVEIASGPNLEERARAARLAVLGPDALTAHTADDQAETVLLRLIRGAGVDGLGAMRPGPTKPMLGLRRLETERVCRTLGIHWVEDPSNGDPRFWRNRVRSEVLPLLSEIADRDVVPLLVRSAAHARSHDDALTDLLPDGDPQDTRWLRTLPADRARLVLRRWIAAQTGRPISSGATDRVMDVATHRTRGTDLEGGWHLGRTGGRLELRSLG